MFLGLFSAAMMAIVPAYISRSVAGSYDNEGVAIFALVFTYYLWVKSGTVTSIFGLTFASKNWVYVLVRALQFVLLLHGRSMGRICIYHESDSSVCTCDDACWQIFK